MAQLILIIEAKTFQEMYLSLSPIEGQRLSILRSWVPAAGGVLERMPLGDSLQGVEPTTLPLLSLQTRHWARNSVKFNPDYLALLRAGVLQEM